MVLKRRRLRDKKNMLLLLLLLLLMMMMMMVVVTVMTALNSVQLRQKVGHAYVSRNTAPPSVIPPISH